MNGDNRDKCKYHNKYEEIDTKKYYIHNYKNGESDNFKKI